MKKILRLLCLTFPLFLSCQDEMFPDETEINISETSSSYQDDTGILIYPPSMNFEDVCQNDGVDPEDYKDLMWAMENFVLRSNPQLRKMLSEFRDSYIDPIKIKINPMIKGKAEYDMATHTISFKSESDMNTDYFLHEFLHAVQFKICYEPWQIDISKRNMEFEVRVFMDLIKANNTGYFAREDTELLEQNVNEGYVDWVVKHGITNNNFFISVDDIFKDDFNFYAVQWSEYWDFSYDKHFTPELIKLFWTNSKFQK